jgi:hypothetical protein
MEVAGSTLAVVLATIVGLAPIRREQPAATFPPQHAEHVVHADGKADAIRDDALRRAKLWRPADPSTVNFANNPPDPRGTLSTPVVRCQFIPRPAHGTTPKFDCVLPDGEVVKVKYGHTGEIHAELAATRLLTALGFGADPVFLIPRVRCYGCPRFPFYVMWALDHLGARAIVTRWMPEDRYTDFEWVAVERRFEGGDIEGSSRKGWAWYELDGVDPSAGASRTEIDAARLMAIFLSHWDNKAANQRLVCQSPLDEGGRCAEPFALIQDLGATFGPNKVDLDNWRATPMWADAKQCTVSMRRFPYKGSTFADVRITEAGRALTARQLAALSDGQLVTLFAAARFPEFHRGAGRGADVNAWVQAFRDKERQIAGAAPCPF